MDDVRPETGLRILWVSPTIGTQFGGPSTTTVNAVIAEHRGGLSTELVSTIGPAESPDDSLPVRRVRDAGVRLRLFRRVGSGYRAEAWGFSPRLAWWLLRNVRNYDVVHLQYVWCLSSVAGALASKLARVPLVVTPHESLTDFDTEVASRNRVLKLLKRVLRNLYLYTADQLILMSRLEERDTRHGSTPARIIYHAVLEEEAGERGFPDSSGIREGLRIAFLGRKVRKKGIHLAINALARRPDAGRKLLVAGPPALDDYQESLDGLAIRLGVEQSVNWLGYIEDRGELLSGCDVLVMPSEYEGFGMVAAEAMGAGLPVIVPRNSGVAEIVSESRAGMILEESTVEALDDALRVFEDSPELLAEMGRNGIEAANRNLTFAAYARKTAQLYKSLTQTGSSGTVRRRSG